MEDEFPDGPDEPGFFREGHEIGGRDGGAVGFSPADESFKAGEHSSVERNDGLIGEAELSLVEGAAEVAFQFELIGGGIP